MLRINAVGLHDGRRDARQGHDGEVAAVPGMTIGRVEQCCQEDQHGDERDVRGYGDQLTPLLVVPYAAPIPLLPLTSAVTAGMSDTCPLIDPSLAMVM